jgi:hypothetical protein
MNTSILRFHDLFSQLGLPSDEPGISEFLSAHSPLPGDIKLSDAPFWTPAQATFLREALLHDSEWAELADQLNQALRAKES